MPILAWVLTNNASLLNACHSLHLRMCEYRLTWDYPRIPTTRAQDDAQSQLITSMPNLWKISICIGHIFNASYHHAGTNPHPLAHLGFSRTFAALSQCASLRKLEISGDCHGAAGLFLFDLFKRIGERLEEISIMMSVLYMLLRANLATDTTHGSISSFPLLAKLTHLSLHIGYLGTTDFNRLSALSKYVPRLTTLVCFCTESRYQLVDDDDLLIPKISVLVYLLFEQVDTVHRWMVSLPTRLMELRFQAWRLISIMDALTQFIAFKKGVFGQRCVETIQLTIDTASFPVVAETDPALLSESEQLLRSTCAQSRIILITSRQV